MRTNKRQYRLVVSARCKNEMQRLGTYQGWLASASTMVFKHWPDAVSHIRLQHFSFALTRMNTSLHETIIRA